MAAALASYDLDTTIKIPKDKYGHPDASIMIDQLPKTVFEQPVKQNTTQRLRSALDKHKTKMAGWRASKNGTTLPVTTLGTTSDYQLQTLPVNSPNTQKDNYFRGGRQSAPCSRPPMSAKAAL